MLLVSLSLWQDNHQEDPFITLPMATNDGNSEVGHPFPDHFLRGALSHENFTDIRSLNVALTTIDQELGWLHQGIKRKSMRNVSGYKEIKRSQNLVFYAVPEREWSEVQGALDQPTYTEYDFPHRTVTAAKKVHTRFTGSKCNASLGKGAAIVFFTDSR